MNEDKSLNKRKWTYEDAVDYVLSNMEKNLRKQFEEDLQWNEELKELYEIALSKKEMLQKFENHKIPERKIKSGFKKVLNLLREDVKPAPGQIWQLNTSNFSSIEKKLFEDLYVLILNTIDLSEFRQIDQEEFSSDQISYDRSLQTSETKNFFLLSDTFKSEYDQYPRNLSTDIGSAYRVVLLSKKPEYALNYDLIFTEPLISFVENNVVAHMHLTGNILKSHLSHYVGYLNDKIFNAIRQADYKDYSSVDNKDVKRKEIDPDVDLEEIDIWTDMVRDVLIGLSHETINYIEENLIQFLKDTANVDSKLLAIKKESPTLYFFKPKSEKKRLKKAKVYLVDEDNYLIIKRSKSDIPDRIKELIIPTIQVPEIKNPHDVPIEEIKKLIYSDSNLEKLEKYRESLTNRGYELHKIDTTNLAETRYAARTSREQFPSNYIELYSDDNFIVSFCFLEKESKLELCVEIVFLLEKNLNKIDFFLFSIEDLFETYFTKNVRVIGGVALIPLYRPPEEIIRNYNQYLIGFKYKKNDIQLRLKLIIQ